MQHAADLPGNPAIADAVFRMQTTPDQVFAHPGWQQAGDNLLDILGKRESALLLGPPGAGKTMLLQALAHMLRDEGAMVRLVEHGELLDGAWPHGVLMVDEAEGISADALAAVYEAPTPFVLAGLPGFKGLDASRPVAVVKLEPLAPPDVTQFVAARLAAAGQPPDMLEAEAVLALARHSGGLLRTVNTLGGMAVFLARLDGSRTVNRKHVDEAAAMHATPDGADAATPVSRKPLLPRRAALGVGLAGLGLALAGWAVWPRRETPGTVVAAASPPRETATTAPADEPDLPDPGYAGPVVVDAPVLYRGPIINETMGQTGRVTLLVRPQSLPGAVKVKFTASAGLIGSGELSGRMSESGRLTVSGTLMMGRNPFACDLRGVIAGGKLTGSATFVRSSGGTVAHSRFTLTRE